MVDTTTDAKRSPEISGVFISIVTALAYAMAFAFEAGTAGAFGIPFEMIDLQLMPAIFGMLVAFSVTITAIRTFDLILLPSLGLKPTDHPVLKEFKLAIVLLALGVILWLLARPVSWLSIVLLSWPLIFYPAIEFLIWLRLWGRKGLLTKIRQPFPDTPLFVEGPMFTALASNQFAQKALLAMFLVLLSAIAGSGNGQRQQDFFVTNLEPETIVLRIYGDRAIAAEFVRAEKRIKPVYRFLRLDDSNLKLRLERIGPITYKEGTQHVEP